MNFRKLFLSLLMAFLFPLTLSAAVLTVNDTGDESDANIGDDICATSTAVCTLRAALEEGNAGDEIQFNLTGPAPFVISLATLLPVATTISIRGETQPGFTGKPLIVLDGQNSLARGFQLGSGALLRGFVIQNFSESGIFMFGFSSSVFGCYIGTDSDGTAAAGNAEGIRVGGAGNVIGGYDGTDLQGNVISGNQVGIRFTGGDNNHVYANFIGVDRSGTVALPNTTAGIEIAFTSNLNYIGNTAEGLGNVISGNAGDGILISSVDSEENYFLANRIGVDLNDNILPNQGNGITLTSAFNEVGGADLSGRNYIIGNQGAGVSCNFCGDTFVSRNVIALNEGDGIEADSTSTIIATQNLIYSNGGLGIDINADDVTLNDPSDADQDDQNYPVITSAVTNGCGDAVIQGVLETAPLALAYDIEIFKSTSADPLGFGEGEVFLGTVNVTTDTNGLASFSLPVASPAIALGEVMTATATRVAMPPISNAQYTSEFSAAFAAERNEDLGMISLSSDTATGAETSGVIQVTVQRECGSFGEVTVDLSTADGSALAGSDYSALSQTLVFADGETSKTVEIQVVNDTEDEADETLTLTLSNPSAGVTLGSSTTATLTITDDDEPAVGSGDNGGGGGSASAGSSGGCSLIR